MGELEDLLSQNIEKFRNKIAEDEKIQKELEGVTRRINIDVIDKEGFSFVLDDKDIKDFKHGKLDDTDVSVTATEEDLIALFKGELKPMRAWATKRLKVKASLEDLMRVRKFFS